MALAPPLTDRWASAERWRLLSRGRWQSLEHNHVFEARGSLAVLRHLSRNREAWHTRAIVLTESMVSLGGRA
ncbi:MAG: hypothetical protein ACPH93_01180, partial [Candidatus Poseidoniaceae archaeon]